MPSTSTSIKLSSPILWHSTQAQQLLYHRHNQHVRRLQSNGFQHAWSVRVDAIAGSTQTGPTDAANLPLPQCTFHSAIPSYCRPVQRHHCAGTCVCALLRTIISLVGGAQQRRRGPVHDYQPYETDHANRPHQGALWFHVCAHVYLVVFDYWCCA